MCSYLKRATPVLEPSIHSGLGTFFFWKLIPRHHQDIVVVLIDIAHEGFPCTSATVFTKAAAFVEETTFNLDRR
jgi:hypothetical protein